MTALPDNTATCPDCRTRCGHEEREHCAADGPRPEPATIGAMLLDAEIQRASGAELMAMRDDEGAHVRRCARRAVRALGAGNDRLLRLLHLDAIAHGANVSRIDDEIARRTAAAEPSEHPLIDDLTIGSAEPYCACGRRWSHCDRSRRGCNIR